MTDTSLLGQYVRTHITSDLPPSAEEMVTSTMRGSHRARRGVLGPLSPSFDPNTWLADVMDNTLTDQIAREVSGRYHVSVTRVYDGSNMIINQFSNKEELKTVRNKLFIYINRLLLIVRLCLPHALFLWCLDCCLQGIGE